MKCLSRFPHVLFHLENPNILLSSVKQYYILAVGINFQQGVVDVFEGYDLQACNNFTIPNKQIGKLTIIHHGTDGWYPEWYALLFDDSTFIECIDDQGVMDNSATHDLFNCGPRKLK